MLKVFNRKHELLKVYKVGYGKNPDKKAKLYEGDNRTPEGVYYIDKILSMDADRSSSSYTELYAMNSVYFSAKGGHNKFGKPGVDLGKNVYGPRFYKINYPNSLDVKQYKKALAKGSIPKLRGRYAGIGSGIAIHGNADPASIGNLASSGCVRMYNNDVIEIEQFIQIGTPVFIVR